MKTLSSSFLSIVSLATLLAVPAWAQFQMPTGSYANEISFSGEAASHGVSGYQGPDASTQGHSLISQNAPAGVAYQFVAGRSDGPDTDGATYATQATTATGFSLFQSVLGTQGYSLADVTVHFGPASMLYENSWSLGLDRNGLNSSSGAELTPGGVLGVNHEWEGWSGSSVEDRFYAAAPGDVFYYLSVGGIRAVDIGYADLYMRIDYGGSTSGDDDVIQAYHLVSGVSIYSGLSGPEYTIADAFVTDVNNAGGGIQVIIDTVQAAVTTAFSYNGEFGSHFAVESRLVAVPLSAVPEPGTYAAWAAVAVLGFVVWQRRRPRRTAPVSPLTRP